MAYLKVGIIVKQTFSIRPLTCIEITGQQASQPVIAAGSFLNLLDDPDFELHRFPHYGLLVSNLLLANCIGMLPSRRILPSPPCAYAYMEQHLSHKSVFITSITKPPSATGACSHPAHALRPLKAFWRLGLLEFPTCHMAPILAPTLTWRHTNTKGRAILSFACSLDPIPLSHTSHAFGSRLKVMHVGPTTIASTLSSSPSSARAATLSVTLLASPLIAPSRPNGRLTPSPLAPHRQVLAPSAMTSPTGSPTSSNPASSPGDGLLSIYSAHLVLLPYGFEWATVPNIPATLTLREAIAFYAFDKRVLPFAELRPLLQQLPNFLRTGSSPVAASLSLFPRAWKSDSSLTLSLPFLLF
ncbi:hypothetical protein BOTBODRAFT_181715 [Botryobasidium botryosum FD-172 SS1]|uniref:Uncharacterized protein n=1 Tax=Botryobasidium botryosum (strain FD-172 SS1) TaxID=930990 RepID=A0A067LTE9_BOTB1|nr:hypothetical protein BOTBODRAFT_181715 [Botryobasidium botryosum FD-172 SS1]